MSDVVTRLVVRADGSLATLDQFERGMQGAGQATDYASGAVADFERRMDAARAAIERGNAVSTQSVARKTAEERAWEKWSATVDRTTALRIRLEREAAQASVAAANAVNMGYTTQEQALTTLMALERRHAAQLASLVQSESAVAANLDQTAMAADRAANSMRRLNAANDNRAMAGQFNTGNIAAQLFDVGVTAPFMPAWQVGLQQGAQLSQAFAGQTLRQSVAGVGTALVSLINPVSLLTIGFTTLTALGIQAFMNMGKGADDATSSLESHQERLDQLLQGYGSLRGAAQTAFDAAMKLPEGIVASDLQATLREQEDAQARIQERIEANRDALAETTAFLKQMQDIARSVGDAPSDLDGAIQQIELMRQLAIDTSSTRTELDAAATAARQLYNTSDDPALKDMADQAYQLALELMAVQAQADSAGAALRALPRDIQIRIAVSEEFSNSMAGIRDLYMDPRSQFDRAREDLETRAQAAQASAQSLAELQALADEYDRVSASINAAEARAAEKSSSRGGGSGNTFADMAKNAQQSISDLRMQAEALQLTGQAASALRHEQELLNQAANDNIALSPAQREEIAALAQSWSEAEAALAGVQFAVGNPDPWQQAMDNIANLDAALAAGAISWEQYGAAAMKANAGAASSVLGLASGLTGALAQMFQDNKAFAVANAVVSTAEAVMRALATYGPTPWGFAAAGVAAATGAAQIAAIMSAQKGTSSAPKAPGGAGAGSAAASPAAQRSTQINVTLGGAGRYSRDEVRDLIEQIADGINDGVDGGKFKVAVNQ